MGFVARVVTAPAKWVGDAIEDVVDFAVEEILEPVVDVAAGVVKGMASDPLTTIATIAAVATGNAWAVPLINGASTAIQGGDPADIALAVASSYVGGKVGPIVGEAVGAEIGGAVGSEAVGRIAGEAAAGATRGVITAAATGGDIASAALMGAASGAGRASFSEAGAYIREGVESSEADYGTADVGAEYFESSEFVDNFNAATESVGIELADIVDTWDSIPEIVQDVITSAAGASISSLAMTGELPEDKQLAAVVTSAAIASRATSSALANLTGISDKSAAQVAKVISDVSRTAYTGADPYEAYKASLSGVFQEDLNKAVDDITDGGLERLFDNIAGSSTAYEEALGKVETQAILVDAAAERVNLAIDQADALRAGEVNIEGIGFYSYEDWKRDRDTYQNSGGSAAGAQALERLRTWSDAYEEQVNQPLAQLRPEYDRQVLLYNAEMEKVSAAQEKLFTDQEYLDQAVEPLYVVANKGFTEALRPDFNEAEYRELNNLSPDTDAHGHWLATGRSNPVSRQELDTQIDSALRENPGIRNLVISQDGKKYRDLKGMQALQDGIVAAAKTAIGDNLEAARNLDLSADPTLTPLTAPARAAIDSFMATVPDDSDVKSAVEEVAEPIAKAPGTTDADIASGKARLVAVNKSLQYAASASGGGQRALQFTTEDVNWTEPAFNPEFNTKTRTVFSPTTNQYIVLDSESGAELKRLAAGGDVLPDGTVVPADDAGVVFTSPLPPPPPTLTEVAKINPVAAIDAAGKLKLNEEEYSKLDFFSRSLVDLSVGVKDTIEYLDTNRAKIKEEYGIDVGDLDGVRKNAGTVLGAGGELLSGFNGIVSFFRNSRNNPIDARTTNLGKATQAMIGIATATQPEEYNNLVKEWNKSYQSAEGIVGTLEAIGEGLLDPKYRSVVLREIIAKEIIQEVPLLLASAGIGTAVKAGVKGGVYVGRQIGKEFAEDTVKQVSRKWGSRAAWGSNAGLQVLETAGATAGETYAITFDELMKLPGMTVEAASARAQEYAITNGLMAAAIEGTIGRVFDPGDKLVSSVVGGQKMKYALDNLTKKAAGIVGEGVSEGVEEGASAYFNYQAVKEINPDSELFKPGGAYDDLGNLLTANSVLGALAGTGTSTSIVAAGSVYNALSGGEPRPPSPLDTPSGGPTGTGPTDTGPTQPKNINTNNVLGNALVNLNPTINQAANDAGSSNPEVRAAGETKIREVFGYDPNYQFDGTTIDVAQDPDGVYRFNTAVDILNAANDNSYNTLGEVQSGFAENAAGVPFVPSSADIQRFVGAAPDVTQTPDAPPATSTDVLRAGIDDFIDQNYTDADEVANYFAGLGYGPSQTEIQQFTGQTPDATQLPTIDPYVDPRQTTTDEVLNYFASLGYTPDQSEVALFTGQGGPDFQTTQLGTVDPYVDPRQVTRSEAEQFFADQNYTPTEDELTRFIAQANDPTFQTTQEQALTTEFDPLAVTEDEARTAFETAGFFDALPADITRLAGQYAEDELTRRAQEALPVATYNSIANVLGKSGQEVTTSDVDFVADIIAQQEVLTEPTPFTQEQLQYDVNADNVVDIADQTMLEQVMAGTVPQTQLAPTSQFAATGIQGQIQQQTQMQQQLQQQIQTQEAERLKRQRQQNQQAYMQQLLETSPVEVKTPDPASIDYVYDPFGESIFATPQQEGLFVDPFTQRNAAAQGGIVSALGGRR